MLAFPSTQTAKGWVMLLEGCTHVASSVRTQKHTFRAGVNVPSTSNKTKIGRSILFAMEAMLLDYQGTEGSAIATSSCDLSHWQLRRASGFFKLGVLWKCII
jgi:hypothetical protein